MTDENNNWLADIAPKCITGIGKVFAIGKTFIGKLCRIIPGLAKLKSESMKIQAEGMINIVKMAERDDCHVSWQKGNIDSIDKIAKEKLRADKAENIEHVDKAENIEHVDKVENIEHVDKAENIEHVDKAENAYDWIAHFIEKAKNTSNKEKQQIWANILARETKTPGSFSIRTIALVEQMDKKDMETFTHFCQFVWNADPVSLIYDCYNSVYDKKGYMFKEIKNLESINLVSHSPINSYQVIHHKNTGVMFYHGIGVWIKVPMSENQKYSIDIGHVMLTQAGQELFSICGAEKNDEFFAYVINKWRELGYDPSVIPHAESGAK